MDRFVVASIALILTLLFIALLKHFADEDFEDVRFIAFLVAAVLSLPYLSAGMLQPMLGVSGIVIGYLAGVAACGAGLSAFYGMGLKQAIWVTVILHSTGAVLIGLGLSFIAAQS